VFPGAKDLVRRLLTRDPRDRITLEECTAVSTCLDICPHASSASTSRCRAVTSPSHPFALSFVLCHISAGHPWITGN
ncbi:unnamed protein product, partial [Closterium sp. NIES-65]